MPSEFMLLVKNAATVTPAQATAPTGENDIQLIVRPKAAAPVTKDDEDDDMTDSVPCPKCSKSEGVIPVDFHKDLMDDDDDEAGGDTTPEEDDDDQGPDGYCCMACKYAWPGDKPTPQQAPARPTEVASAQPDAAIAKDATAETPATPAAEPTSAPETPTATAN